MDRRTFLALLATPAVLALLDAPLGSAREPLEPEAWLDRERGFC